MKRNHLFASAAIGAVLAVTLPAQAQILGGGMHGGVSGMQTATFGGGFGTLHSAASTQTDPSASARARGRVDGLGRLDRTAKTGTQQAARDAERAKGDAVVAGRGAVSAGEFEATKASDAALGTSRAAVDSTAPSVTSAGQGETQVRYVDAPSAVAGTSSTCLSRPSARCSTSSSSHHLQHARNRTRTGTMWSAARAKLPKRRSIRSVCSKRTCMLALVTARPP
jgi:hypothetical protein